MEGRAEDEADEMAEREACKAGDDAGGAGFRGTEDMAAGRPAFLVGGTLRWTHEDDVKMSVPLASR